jgi:hypothetical protein
MDMEPLMAVKIGEVHLDRATYSYNFEIRLLRGKVIRCDRGFATAHAAEIAAVNTLQAIGNGLSPVLGVVRKELGEGQCVSFQLVLHEQRSPSNDSASERTAGDRPMTRREPVRSQHWGLRRRVIALLQLAKRF